MLGLLVLFFRAVAYFISLVMHEVPCQTLYNVKRSTNGCLGRGPGSCLVTHFLIMGASSPWFKSKQTRLVSTSVTVNLQKMCLGPHGLTEAMSWQMTEFCWVGTMCFVGFWCLNVKGFRWGSLPPIWPTHPHYLLGTCGHPPHLPDSATGDFEAELI